MRRALAAALLVLAPALLPVVVDAQQAGVDVSRYRFALSLPDTGKVIRAEAQVQFTRTREVDALRLDLLPPMALRGAMLGCDNQATVVAATHERGVVTVPLPAFTKATRAANDPRAMEPLDSMCVTVRYDGAPTDGLIISTDTAGRWRAFGDNWPNRARHWLASVDHPSDKALVEFVVDAPTARTVVANGTQRERVAQGARTRTTWATAAPIPTYLMVIAAAPLTVTELGQTACGLASVARCVPQRVYTAPEQASAMPGNFAQADSIVSFFSRLVGPFPYEQLAHLQSSTRFGGMENAGAIFYNDALFRTPAGVSVGLIAHEVAHQWFGNAVTEAEWGHLWLSEGFATYFAALYTEHASGDSAFRAELEGMRRSILDAKVVAERPVIDSTQTNLLALLNANSYQKGGFVLHMLRREVGDSAFFRGVRAYWTPRVHGNARTDDLRAVMEREVGRDLSWFFDQWLRRPGYVEPTVRYAYDSARRQVKLIVEQGTRFAPYRFPLTVEFTMDDGSRRTVRVNVPAQVMSEIAVREPFERAPTAMRADPRIDLLAGIRTP